MVAILEAEHFKSISGIHHSLVPFRIVTSSEGTFREPVFVAPFDCEIKEVSIIASTAVAGAATNFVALNLIDGGAEGAGTSEIANLDIDSGVTLAAGKTQLFDGSTVALEHFLSQGDILELEAEENGTGDGIDMPEMIIYIAYRAAERAS